MNANELADWIHVTDFYNNTDNHFINDTMDEVEAMLRQQQAEIEALKKQVVAWEKSAMDCRINLELSQCTRYFDKAQEK